jgi:hypothetical protein
VEADARERQRKRLLEVKERHANLAAAGLANSATIIKAALEAGRDPEALAELLKAAKKNSESLRALFELATKQATAIRALTDTERLALGLATEVVEVGERPAADPLAEALAEDPDALGRIAAALAGLGKK